MSDEKVRGRLSVHRRGFGFLRLDEVREGEAWTPPPPRYAGGSAFIPPPALNPFLRGDVVAATLVVERDGRFSARDLELVERSRTELMGAVVRRGRKAFVAVDREVANTDWPLGGAKGIEAGTVVVARIDGERLVDPRPVDPDEADLIATLVRWEVRREFPAVCLEEARAARQPKLGRRRDLRDVPTVTIDSASTRDIDDALSALAPQPDGGLRVLVSIADVDALVEEGSALDVEARRRGTSVYLPDRVVPMLPPALSEGALSLLPGEDRPALTCELRIDPEGEVTSVDVYLSLVRSHARLTYRGAAAFLEEGDATDVPAPVRDTVRWLRTAAARLSTVRAARGGFSVVREEARLTFDPDTREPIGIGARRETTAHRLVERLMVAANEAVAGWLIDRGLPGVFRRHDPPERAGVERLASFARNFGFEPGFGPALTPRALAAFEEQFKDATVAPAIRTVLRWALGPARYSVHPGPHFGLASPRYLHFTSPIRRYADLAVHRVVVDYLEGERDLEVGDPELETLAVHLGERAYLAAKAENQRLWCLSARLFQEKIGEVHEGNIVDVKPFGLVVQLAGTGVSGTVSAEALGEGSWRVDPATHAFVGPKGRSYAIGEPLRIRVAGADDREGRIELEPADG